MRTLLAAVAIFSVGLTPTAWTEDASPEPVMDPCHAVEAEAVEVMTARQRRWEYPDSPFAEDASRYPLFAYPADQNRIILAFADKHLRLCRLQEHGITSYEP
jgi:hypothetical protein